MLKQHVQAGGHDEGQAARCTKNRDSRKKPGLSSLDGHEAGAEFHAFDGHLVGVGVESRCAQFGGEAVHDFPGHDGSAEFVAEADGDVFFLYAVELDAFDPLVQDWDALGFDPAFFEGDVDLGDLAGHVHDVWTTLAGSDLALFVGDGLIGDVQT